MFVFLKPRHQEYNLLFPKVCLLFFLSKNQAKKYFKKNGKENRHASNINLKLHKIFAAIYFGLAAALLAGIYQKPVLLN